jgi:hypothetical protein
MAMTATERSRVRRERRASGKVMLTVIVGEDELAEIARAGYAEAASTDRKDREAAVSLFLSDAAGGSRNEDADRGSRDLICPAAALAACRRAAPRAKTAEAMLATRLRATSLHRVVSAVVLAGLPLSTLAACRRAAPRARPVNDCERRSGSLSA